MISQQYSELCFKGPNLDEVGACLIALGAAGAAQEEPDILRCYIDDQSCNRSVICEFAAAQGLTLISALAVEEKNWVALSSEVWSDLSVGRLTIHPVADASGPGASALDIIRVIPGEGFGTGHHPSTRQALCLLQNRSIAAAGPKNIIDVGTGSGILAIASARLFDAEVKAYDTDERALVNASENIELNGVVNKIALAAGPLPLGTHCDLLIANIYAEVLLQYEQNFFASLNSAGFLILAGIMQTRLEALMLGFKPSRWRMVEQLSEGGWCAILYSTMRSH